MRPSTTPSTSALISSMMSMGAALYLPRAPRRCRARALRRYDRSSTARQLLEGADHAVEIRDRARKETRCAPRPDRPARPRVHTRRGVVAARVSLTMPPFGNCCPRMCGAGLVLSQGREGACTGFGLACVVNYLYCAQARAVRQPRAKTSRTRQHAHAVSPRAFLRRMARRGLRRVVCRGALKGWNKHGVCAERCGRIATAVVACVFIKPKTGLGHRRAAATARRVLPHREDLNRRHAGGDLSKLGAIYVSSDVHDGWDVAVEGAHDQGSRLVAGDRRDRGPREHRRPRVSRWSATTSAASWCRTRGIPMWGLERICDVAVLTNGRNTAATPGCARSACPAKRRRWHTPNGKYDACRARASPTACIVTTAPKNDRPRVNAIVAPWTSDAAYRAHAWSWTTTVG